MRPWWILLLLILAADSGARVTPPMDIFRRQALTVLRDALEHPPPQYWRASMRRLAVASGLREARVRQCLGALLDTLEQHRREDTPAWRQLVSIGGDEVPKHRAERFLRQLSASLRDMVADDGDYQMGHILRRASGAAGLYGDQGRDYLLGATAMGMGTPETVGPTRGAAGVIVSGHTSSFEVSLEPLYLFLRSRDQGLATEAVRDLQRFVVPAVVASLPERPAVLWAVRRREANVLLQPDYRLHLEVEGLRFTGTNVDLRPCMELGVELADTSGTVLLQQSLDLCTEEHGSASTQSLEPFYREVAREVALLIDEFLSP